MLMNKEDIISILREENIIDDIENGPTVVIASKGKKTFELAIKREENNIYVSMGKILRHTIKIPISELIINL